MEIEELLGRIDKMEEELIEVQDATNERFYKVVDSISHYESNIRDIEAQFEKATHLEWDDYPFVLFCAGLQACRQYFLTNFNERLSDKEAAKEVKGDRTEKSNRNKQRYYCSIENILTNPVPYDALNHSENTNPGVSGNDHRWKCLGHYPELGYIFGTANIMTSTMTVKEGLANICTYHVSTEKLSQTRHYRRTDETRTYQIQTDVVSGKAHTDKMFEHCIRRIRINPHEGISALITALAKQHEHLRSDENSKQSLPFPWLSFSPAIAEGLHNYGLDYLNLKTITRQAIYSYFVNLVTVILYYAYHIGKDMMNVHSPEEVKKMKIADTTKVKLQKIINVANVIATSTNLGAAISGVCMGNLAMIRSLDIGGSLITLRTLSKSADFMMEVKSEYVRHEMNKLNEQI